MSDKSFDSETGKGTSLSAIIDRYARTWSLLLQYDEDRLQRPKKPQPLQKPLEYEQAKKAITTFKAELIKRGEAGDLFGLERDHALQGILGNIDQTFDGADLYPGVEEKAAHLLSFVIKDRPFSAIPGYERSA